MQATNTVVSYLNSGPKLNHNSLSCLAPFNLIYTIIIPRWVWSLDSLLLFNNESMSIH